MAYFNHSFQKFFLGTGVSQATSPGAGEIPSVITGVESDGGFVTTTGVYTYQLNEMSQGVATYFQSSLPTGFPATITNYQNGYFGIFDPKTNRSIAPENCCNVYIAGSAIYSNDKIGPFHGGYQETNKSKMINPRYVQSFYRVDPCTPQNAVLHVGSTFWTAGGGVIDVDTLVAGTGYANGTYTVEVTGGAGTGAILEIVVTGNTVDSATIVNPGKGYAVNDTLTLVGGNNDATVDVADVTIANVDPITGFGGGSCCHEFLCGETYYLRLDIKGSPALRFLNHNAYYNAEAYTGCCDPASIAPTAVDSTEVMIKWANAFLRYPLTNPFIQIIIQDEAGVLWYAPGTSAAELAALGGDSWDNYVSPGHVDGACAGLIIQGAYVDTKFGNCSFQISDFYEKEPVRLYASEVDVNGDPCEFTGLCVVNECFPRQAMGFGETVLRDLILSEQYRQNFFSTDIRIREITQGNQMLNVIDRNALYTRYYLLHSVPRFNNPTGTFDNDRYLLEFVTNGTLTGFETTVNNWLQGCGTECAFEEFVCETECQVPITFPKTPTTPYLFEAYAGSPA
jgi:hypothetical protein